MLLLSLLLTLDGPSGPVEATDLKYDIFEILEEQDVSMGSARKATIRTSPGSVWTLDDATLHNTAAWSLYDVLRTIPGQIVQEISGTQVEAPMRFQGSFPDHQALVMVDGRSALAEPLGNFDRQLINLQDIERVEIVFGPSSTLYGANAYSGVMNIITKAPKLYGLSVTAKADGGLGTGAPFGVGSRLFAGALAGGHAALGYGWGSGGMRLSVSGQHTPEFGTSWERFYTMPPASAVNASGLADVLQNAGAWTLRMQAQAFYKKSQMQLLGVADTEQHDYSANVTATRNVLAGKDDVLKISAWARHNEINMPHFLPTFGGFATNNRANSFELRVDYSLPIFWRNALSVGMQGRALFIESGLIASAAQRQLLAGVYVEDVFRPIDALIISAGMRVDTREIFDGQPFRWLSYSPRGSIVWLLNDRHTLRAEYGSAFRTPTAVESYGQVIAPDGTLVLQGQPGIDLERVHSWSLAYLGRYRWLSWRLEGYVSRTFGNIRFRAVDPNDMTRNESMGLPLTADPRAPVKLPIYFYNDPNGFLVPGAVARIDFQPLPQWRGFLNYTFSPINRQHTAGVGSDLTLGPVDWSIQAYFLDQSAPSVISDIAARLVVNTRVGVALTPDRRLQLAVTGTNLVDVHWFFRRRPGAPALQYGDSPSGERVGPRLWASLSYTFN